MEPRISVVTLGVADLARSYRFYRDGCRRSIPAILCHRMTLDDRHPLPTFCPQTIKGLTAVTSDQGP
jgi:catechol 2,3-dioxygenase-like lactoylglutathione lyase family enzyme